MRSFLKSWWPRCGSSQSVFKCNLISEEQGGQRARQESILFRLIKRIEIEWIRPLCLSEDHIPLQHLRSSAPSESTPLESNKRPLTLQLGGAQAFFKPLHFILQEADMPHHVLWWVYLHGNISWRGGSWYGLVQLLLKDSTLENKPITVLVFFFFKCRT